MLVFIEEVSIDVKRNIINIAIAGCVLCFVYGAVELYEGGITV